MHSYTPYPTNEVDDERAPLSANAADFGQNNTGFYPPRTDNQFPPGPGFLSQDPRMRRPAPQRAPSAAQSEAEWKARAATVKRGATRRVKLTRDGHFVANYATPPAVCNSQERQYRDASARAGHPEEFTHLRYTAATVDPNDFTPMQGWSLRSTLWGRETELLIAITSYNEDKNLYSRTLHAVMENIRDIAKSKSKFWRKGTEEGRSSWEKIVVCLVADGIDPCDKGTLDLLATVGVYQDNIMKRQVDGKDVTCHIFEYTTQISVDSTSSSKPSLIVPAAGNDKANLVPVQIIFCLKQKNAKKINSHRWVFNAFASQLKPEVCILIDSGTKPGRKSLYELWSCFYNNSHVGGCAGEIYTMTSGGRKLLNPLVASQNFEYKMSNILDKPLESSFGYVSVLPGAFSAYRWSAIQGRPLAQYFHGDASYPKQVSGKNTADMSLFAKNMYLAEDRILCFEIVTKANANWVLKYVKEAKGETDVPEGAAEFISQRRRWLNGSLAASVYSIIHFYRVYRSNHNLLRLFALHVQLLFNIFQLIFTWFSLANLWLSFSIIIQLLPKNNIVLFGTLEITHWVNLSLQWLYAGTLALQFVLALGNRPKGEVPTYIASFIVFGFMAYYLLVCAVILTIKAFTKVDFVNAATIQDKLIILFTGTNGVLLAALFSTFGLYIVSSVLYLDFWHLFTSFPQYVAVAPSMINILTVYALSNLHDVSWGTKGSDKADALPSVSSKKDGEKDAVVEEVEKSSQDLESAFQETVKKALAPVKTVEDQSKPTQDDDNRTFRTRLLATWLLSNGALVIAIQNANGLNSTEAQEQAKTTTYFNVILWCTAGLSLIRFIGCVWFRMINVFKRCCRKT